MFSTKLPHRNPQLSDFYMNNRKFIPKVLRPWIEQKIIYAIRPDVYDLYMSLGENCLPATSLKQVNLRKFSGPFDWIDKSDFQLRVSQIESNFEDALNYEDLLFNLDLRTDRRNNTCSVQNKRTGFVYPHDFEDDSRECFLKQKAKYQRRQNRMYSLAKDANGLFLYADLHSGLQYPDYSPRIEEYCSLLERLRSKLGMKRISLILGVKAAPDSDTQSVDVYEKETLRLFIQPIPEKYLAATCNMFDWPSVFLKRALRVATDYELRTRV